MNSRPKNIAKIFLLLAILIETPLAGSVTDSLSSETIVSVVPGEEYQAGWFHRLIFGSQWRDLWTSSINVPVLDLDKEAGGLTPLKTGGGFQTKSLHFKANNGKYYKFRSINKDPKKVIPEYFRETFVEDVVQDMISTAHPLAPVIATPLLNAVGVLNATPRIIVLPEDEKLGSYREDFQDVLGTFSENPKDETDPELVFAGADKIIKNYKIFEVVEEDNDNQVDGVEFLKARLMDIYMGDWDRHIKQWKWARFKNGKKRRWVPIPRDRDQVFALYNGILPWMVTLAVPQIEGFRENYPQINDLTWSGRYLDRRFLVSVDKRTWDSVTTYIQTHLTDTVIEEAVRQMPEEWFVKEGNQLIHTLKKRRDKLANISGDYYDMIFSYVSIYGSNKREFADINRLNNDHVDVSIFKKDKQTGQKTGEPFFHRIFHREETKEIRIDLLGGDDTMVVEGIVDESITLRLTGGEGKDTLIDSSVVNGYFLNLTPFKSPETETIFYDSGKKTTFVTGPSSKINTDQAPKYKPFDPEKDNIHEKYEPQTEDRGHDWKAGFWLGYNSSDGLLIGGGPILYEFGYRVIPYVYRMSLQLAYVTNIETFVLDYSGEFYRLIKNHRTRLKISKLTAHTFFYGYGNETPRDASREDMDFYRFRPDLFDITIDLDFKISEKHYFWIGMSYDNSISKFDPATILDSLQLDNTGERSQIGIQAGYSLDTRDNDVMPYSGYYINLKALYSPGLIEHKLKYQKISLDSRAYFRTEFLTTSSIAFRFLGEFVGGNYPLHRSAFLGGQSNLLGYERSRFSGNALLFAAAALRSYLFPLKILIPAKVGFSLFAETGRIFYNGENSKKWHPSFGGGAWISFLERQLSFNLTVAKSPETTIFYITTGYLF